MLSKLPKQMKQLVKTVQDSHESSGQLELTVSLVAS